MNIFVKIKNNMNPKADFFFDKPSQWQDEYKLLRKIMLSTQLAEEVKWGVPCYTLNNKNVVLIHGFKEYCAILFHKGALMSDTEGILIQQTENVQSARQVRFTSLTEIEQLKDVIVTYVTDAIRIEQAGLKVEMKKTADYDMPAVFKKYLDVDADLRRAFQLLTPGRQRAYLFHFSQPKLEQTKLARVEKCIPRILDGKGMED
jgi:uncharacterized protein YdeI (YjbR/CyaY-like superfamily)